MNLRFWPWVHLVLGLLLGISGPTTKAETIKIALFEYPPFLAEKATGYGLEPQVVSAAFKQVNIDVKYTFLPPGRALLVAANGDFQATLGWVKTEERERDFYFSEPIAEAPLVFFHLKNFPFSWNTYDDLEGVLIGTVIKYNYGDEFETALKAGKIQIDEAGKDESNFKKLLLGRNAITPVNLYVGYYLLQETFGPATAKLFTHHPLPLKISVHHVLFPKALKESFSRSVLFNQGLQKIKDSGEYKKILDEYHLKSRK